jgi:hypothetical protein
MAIDNQPVQNGLFTVQIDFTDAMWGDVYFYLNGDARWLRIGVRPGASTGTYTYLAPLQPLTPAPYALALPGMNTVQNDTSANVLGGYSWNYANPNIVGATIGGGGYDGGRNEVQKDYATVSGGASNVASGQYAAVAGGGTNTASSFASAICGGESNEATNTYATVAGGWDNAAAATSSFAAGYRAKANHAGSFVWADYTAADFASTGNNRFEVRASGGARFQANSSSYGMYVDNDGSGDGLRSLASVSAGNNWAAVYAVNTGTSPAIYANTNGTYSGYFEDNIWVTGNCVGCTLVYLGRNDGAEPLETGDLVAVSGLGSPLTGNSDPLLLVHLANTGWAESVVGIVQERAILVESEREGQRTQSANRVQGADAAAIQPGEYLFIVVQGMAQVKADAAEGGISPGQRLTAAARPGHARILQTRIVEGMVVAEGAATIGVALGPLDAGTGLIPVMVTLR